MQKNKLNLRICGIHLLNPYKTVVSHLKVPTLLRIRVRGHFVTSITKNHESHYVTVLDNPVFQM